MFVNFVPMFVNSVPSRVPPSLNRTIRKMKSLKARENEAVIDRRKLLRILPLLGLLTALTSACRHHRPYEEKEEPKLLKREGGGY